MPRIDSPLHRLFRYFSWCIAFFLTLTGCTTTPTTPSTPSTPKSTVKTLKRADASEQLPLKRVLAIYEETRDSQKFLGGDFSKKFRAEIESQLQIRDIKTASLEFPELRSDNGEWEAKYRATAPGLAATHILDIKLIRVTAYFKDISSDGITTPGRLPYVKLVMFEIILQDMVSLKFAWQADITFEGRPTPELVAETVLKELVKEGFLQ